MIVEYIRYTISPDRQAAFEAAHGAAQASLAASGNCHGWELARGVEEPSSYILRIEWDSVAGHMQGFRQSPSFAPSSPPSGRLSAISRRCVTTS